MGATPTNFRPSVDLTEYETMALVAKRLIGGGGYAFRRNSNH